VKSKTDKFNLYLFLVLLSKCIVLAGVASASANILI